MTLIESAETDPQLRARLKPGNGAYIRWRYPDRRRTPHAVLYLHGFSASAAEAADLPAGIADGLDANLLVHRWPGHGIDNPYAMQGLSLPQLHASATHALQSAMALGDHVAIVGMSMGATLGLQLAADHAGQVTAIVAWSPGIAPVQADLLDSLCAHTEPVLDTRSKTAQMLATSTHIHHPDGFRALRELFDDLASNPPWPRIRCPVMLAYYRGADGNEDPTASVPAMLQMFDLLDTPLHGKRAYAFDAGVHAIGSPHRSPVAAEVAQATLQFLREQLGP